MYYHLNRKSPLMIGLSDLQYIIFEPGFHHMTEGFYELFKNNKSLIPYIKSGQLSFNTDPHESIAEAFDINEFNSHDVTDLLEQIHDIPALEEWARKAIDFKVRQVVRERVRMLNGSNPL